MLDQNETLLLRKNYGLFAQLKCGHRMGQRGSRRVRRDLFRPTLRSVNCLYFFRYFDVLGGGIAEDLGWGNFMRCWAGKNRYYQISSMYTFHKNNSFYSLIIGGDEKTGGPCCNTLTAVHIVTGQIIHNSYGVAIMFRSVLV